MRLVSSAMFDWDDEELTNIIWDEAGERDDHIVPFPDASENIFKKKEWSQAGTIKSTEQKPPWANVKIHARSSSNFETRKETSTSVFDMDSWPNLSVSNAAKTDQDSLNISVSNNLSEFTKYDSSRGGTAQLDKDPENFQYSKEGKESGDFVDYGWANIGSFDDLDRIFSNNNYDPIFGNGSLGNADEIWSSSKSVDSPSLCLGAFRNTSENFEINTDYVQEDGLPFSLDYGKVSDPASHDLQNACTVLDNVESAGGKNKPMVKEQTDLNIIVHNDAADYSELTSENITAPNQSSDKAYKQNKLLKNQKKLQERSELNMHPDLFGNWSASGNITAQFKNGFVPSIMQYSPSSVLTQQRQIQEHESLQDHQICNPFIGISAYGSITNPFSAIPELSDIMSGELNQQPLLSGYDVSSHDANPVNKLADHLARPRAMKPHKKIIKARRWQQLRAMLAIQKQQQQFGHKVFTSDQSTKKCSKENQLQHFEVSDLEVEDQSTLPSFDPNSPIEQDDSNTISLAVNDNSVENTILYRLQDIIEKLDVRMRLCTRDSLLRLAQSAMQRHYVSDASSTSNSITDEKVFMKEDAVNHSRNVEMPEVETKTNSIDRTVAHLLFHKPPEFSRKHPDTPESPVSVELPCEHKAVSITKLPMSFLPEKMEDEQNFPLQASKISCFLADSQPVSWCKSSLCFNPSENASNIGPVDDGAREVEAS